MVVSGGENIYPVEVENTPRQTEMVVDVAAIGVPDDKSARPVGLVVTKPGMTLGGRNDRFLPTRSPATRSRSAGDRRGTSAQPSGKISSKGAANPTGKPRVERSASEAPRRPVDMQPIESKDGVRVFEFRILCKDGMRGWGHEGSGQGLEL